MTSSICIERHQKQWVDPQTKWTKQVGLGKVLCVRDPPRANLHGMRKKNESVVGLSRWRWVDTSDTPIYRLLYWSSTSLNRVSSHVVKVRYRSDFIDPNDNKTNHCFNVLFKIYATISFFFLDFYLQILSNQFIHNILYIF